MKIGNFFIIVVSVAAGLVIGQLLPPFLHCKIEDKALGDESIVIDTLPYYVPVPVDSVVTKYVTAKLPAVRDTLCDTIAYIDSVRHDSAKVIIPITQVEYKDSMYRAWVSGYRPQLDSIKIYQRTITRTVIRNGGRFGIGIMGGYGFGTSGPSPFVGVGFYYRIFNF